MPFLKESSTSAGVPTCTACSKGLGEVLYLAGFEAIHNRFDQAANALAALGHADNFHQAIGRHAINQGPGHRAGLAQVQ